MAAETPPLGMGVTGRQMREEGPQGYNSPQVAQETSGMQLKGPKGAHHSCWGGLFGNQLPHLGLSNPNNSLVQEAELRWNHL